jgi:hypothetical protein
VGGVILFAILVAVGCVVLFVVAMLFLGFISRHNDGRD